MFDRNRVRLTLTFAVLAMITCAPSAFGQATTTDNPFSNVPVTNDCNGDTVLMTGTLHTETSFFTNPNGMTHTSFNFTTHATGVDQTNPTMNYAINDSSHSESNTKGIAQELSTGAKMKMIAQGPYPGITERLTLHVVTDNNGNVRVDMSKFQLSCN